MLRDKPQSLLESMRSTNFNVTLNYIFSAFFFFHRSKNLHKNHIIAQMLQHDVASSDIAHRAFGMEMI